MAPRLVCCWAFRHGIQALRLTPDANTQTPTMIAIVDYGMGNLRSVEKALHKLGHTARISSDPSEIEAADRVILPGVGAFGAAMANLKKPVSGSTLAHAVCRAAASGKPFFGICLGMQ